MTKICTANITRHWRLLIILCMTTTVRGGEFEPLTSTEQQAVIGEIRALVETNRDDKDKFAVKEATPERIERLYRMPQLQELTKDERQHGLFFAGKSQLLAFDKPSDVIKKIENWFPKEVAAARASKDQQFFSYLDLFDYPFRNWESEPAAFAGLWNCMPQSAWMNPLANPFRLTLKEPHPSMEPIAAEGTKGVIENDFGFCIRERNGYRTGLTKDIQSQNVAKANATATQITPVLQDKFYRFLHANRCRGTGPDDCVLVLHLWAGLASDDPNLAKTITELEPEVALDQPLPAFQQSINPNWGAHPEEKRLDEALRRAAFLRSKLRSVLTASAAWPDDSLSTTLRQISSLQEVFNDPTVQRHWPYYDLEYYNVHLSPYVIVRQEIDHNPRLWKAVVSEIDRVCPDHLQNFNKCLWDSVASSVFFQATAAFNNCQNKGECWLRDNALFWLHNGEIEEAVKFRQRILDWLDHEANSAARESLLSQFATRNANTAMDCFESEPIPDWKKALCRRWIHEPQHTSFHLAHSGLTLTPEGFFRKTAVYSSENAPPDTNWQTKLDKILDADIARKLRQKITALAPPQAKVDRINFWTHPKHDTLLVTVAISGDKGRNLIVTQSEITEINIPKRFEEESYSPQWGYNRQHLLLNHISDVDADGQLEFWYAADRSGCQGDASDLERDLDCRPKSTEMGEIQGSTLSWFVKSKPRANVKPLAVHAIADATELGGRFNSFCANAALIGTVLAKPLDTKFFVEDKDHDSPEILSLICKPHPINPEQTIVALFHTLKDRPKTDGLETQGFVYAVIDLNKKQLLRLYRDTVEEDGGTRIDEYSLEIDTTRYNLAPGIRALGVRKHIGHSPRCADGGESNYLTLFIEKGDKLEPVLKDLPMSEWRMISGSNCGMEADTAVSDNIELTIKLAETSSEGFKDLHLIAHHNIQNVSAESVGTTKKQSVGLLKMKHGHYEVPYLGNKLWQ